MLDPQFQGQIKERLNSRDAVRLVSSFVRPALELWLNQHVEYGKKLAELAIRAAQSRQKAGQKVEKRGQASPCCPANRPTRNKDPRTTRSSTRATCRRQRQDGRDKKCQAILPLRGKVLNTWEVERDRLFANTEIHDIAVASAWIRTVPTTPSTSRACATARFCILSDADVDGSHIQVLLLTLFFRHFPKLIDSGNVYVARPPLFRVDAPRAARSRRPSCMRWTRANSPPSSTSCARKACGRLLDHQPLQGPGRDERGTIVGNHAQSRYPRLPVQLGKFDFAGTENLTKLMGKGEAAARRELMELHGDAVEIDI